MNAKGKLAYEAGRAKGDAVVEYFRPSEAIEAGHFPNLPNEMFDLMSEYSTGPAKQYAASGFLMSVARELSRLNRENVEARRLVRRLREALAERDDED